MNRSAEHCFSRREGREPRVCPLTLDRTFSIIRNCHWRLAQWLLTIALFDPTSLLVFITIFAETSGDPSEHPLGNVRDRVFGRTELIVRRIHLGKQSVVNGPQEFRTPGRILDFRAAHANFLAVNTPSPLPRDRPRF